MKVEIVKPTERLKSIIKSYTIIETKFPIETTVLPHLGLVIAIQFKGNVLLCNADETQPIPAVTVSGMRKNFRKFSYQANTSILLISFTESGAFTLFGETVFELFGIFESLDNIMKSSVVSEIQGQIAFAKSNKERIKCIDNFLISNLKNAQTDKLVLHAITEIQASQGIRKITDLSKQFNISQDAFEKRFRSIVGTSPKQFSTIVKMKSLVDSQKQYHCLTDLAYSYEFYDQSHFVKQFKDFSGQAPKRFFRTPYNW